jgi:hypothetical protein
MKKRVLHLKGVKTFLIALFLLLGTAAATTAQTNYYVSTAGNDLTGNGTFGNPYATIQKAVDISASGDIVNIAAGTYPESVTVSKSLTIQGADSATVILDKGDANYNDNNGNNGFTVSANNVTIKLLKIRNYRHAVTNTVSVSNLTINQCTMLDNYSTAFYPGASFNGLTISNCIMRYNGNRYNVNNGIGFRRAVFLQAGSSAFSNLVMTNNIVTNNGLVGLDLNLANSISGVTITGNTLSSNGDAELSVWLGASTPTSNAVLIDNNNITITNTGRFGIEIKNPNGTGANSGVGSVVVSNNIINVSSHTGATRDMGGIVVIRRKDATPTVNDQPQGVVIFGNTINDMQNINANTNDAYAIAVGGTGHKILNNTITNAEISIQLQKGNDNYLTDNNSDQALVNFYFSRDNSKDVCVEIGTNTITSSGAPRLVTAAAVSSLTLPTTVASNSTLGTTFCSIQQAIDFSATITGHTVTAQTGTHDGQVIINKSITLDGVDSTNTIIALTTASSGVKSLFTVTAQNVTIKNFKFNVDFVRVHSAIASSGNVSGLTIMGNHIKAAYTSGTTLSYSSRNGININLFGTANATAVNSEPLIQDVVIKSNSIDTAIGTGAVVFRSGISADRVRNLTVGGNTATDGNNFIASINHDLITRFYFGSQTIKNNSLNGGGIELSTPNEAGAVDISNNTFNGIWSKGNKWHMLRVLNGATGRTITISNNQFTDQKCAITLENTKNVVVNNNSFTATVNGFRLVSVNTKLRTNGASPSPLEIMSASITNNTFSTSGVFATGNAVEFLNFDQQVDNNYLQGTYELGSLGNENTFNANIPQFVYVSNSNGVNTQDVGFTTLYPEYNDGGLSTSTTTGYWTKNIDARNNRYFVNGSLKLASAFSPADYTVVPLAIFDKTDDANIARVLFATPIWTGATNTDWSIPTNWSIGVVPAAGLDAVIESAPNQPTLTAAATCDTLTLATGTTLTTGANTLNVLGHIKNSGTISATSGTITLSGSAAQTVTGGFTTSNLTLNNASGATITTGAANLITLLDTYAPTSGVLTTNGNLLLKSTATGTARIAAGTGTYISGTVTQQRFVPAKAGRTWSLLASPFSQSIASSWQQQIHITGTGTGGTACPTLTSHSNGFDATIANAASMFVYDGTKAVNTRWTSVTGTSSVNLTAGTGYRVNVRGPRSTGCGLLDGTVTATSDATLSSSGTLSAANKNAGSFTIDYSNNGDATVANDNYLLIGNPYPSQISFAQLRTDNSTKIGTSYAIYGPANTIGNYAYWDGATFTGANTGLNNTTGDIIANGQAFFVQSSIAGGNITALAFNENQKIATANNGYFRAQPNPNMVRIGYMFDNGNKADEIIIQFANNGTTDQLNEDDIVSMNTGSQNLKSVKGARQMAINTRPVNFITDTIALNVASTSNGTFKLHFSDLGKLAADIYLIDRYSNTVQKINDQDDVSFSVNTSIPETKGSNRFAVVFSKKQPVMAVATATIKAYPNPVTDAFVVTLPETSSSYSISLTDVTGKVLRQLKAVGGNTNINVSKFSTGTYFLEVTNDKGLKTVQKIVKQ